MSNRSPNRARRAGGPSAQTARVALSAEPPEATPAKEQEQFAAAAAAFAQAVGGEDPAARIQLFQAAFNLADMLSGRSIVERGAAVANLTRAMGLATHMAEPPAAMFAARALPTSILEDPVFIENSQALLADPGAITEMTDTDGGPARILGGVTTQRFPDCVAIGSASRFCCTGTLVAPRVVVTAGHCHDGGCSSRVFIGTDVNLPASGRIIPVARQEIHPEFDSDTLMNDLTVLILAEAVGDVAPRSIATAGMIDAATRFRLAGYGTTNPAGTVGFGIRRMVDVPRASDDGPWGAHAGLEFVAGAPFLDRDSCRGDSGGPAYVRQSGKYHLAGATSRGVPSTSTSRLCGDGGIYVRIEKYLPFIRSVAGDLFPGT